MAVKHTIVLVEWADAYEVSDWTSPDELDQEPVIVQSIGFLLPEYKENYVVICQSDDGQGELDNYLFIPAGMVIKLHVV